ncbi:hypothetical protein [Halomonas sp. RA08-2]|uniref:PIN-like domain-containing protein n=1 Tax=Halomonas sp. RA08-2 TaxID=3440842 RepID=UPI003EF06DBA
MNFFIDENINIHLAPALDHLSKVCKGGHRAYNILDLFETRGIPDEEWLAKLSSEPNWVIISKDRFGKGAPERAVFQQAGVPIYNLGSDWKRKAKSGWDEAVQLIRWWPTLTDHALNAKHPMRHELPWGVTTKIPAFRFPKS